MDTQSILARVKLKHVQGADIAYFYNYKIFKELGLKPSEFDPTETFLNVGDVITYDDKKYKIVKIHSKFFNETTDLNTGKGTNLLGVGEQLPFNFQITYELDDKI